MARNLAVGGANFCFEKAKKSKKRQKNQKNSKKIKKYFQKRLTLPCVSGIISKLSARATLRRSAKKRAVARSVHERED